MKLLGKVFINSQIEVKTGLSIGGSKTDVEIGGVDDSVIKNSQGIPYIPGSSLKGKLRSLLEIKDGKYSGKIKVNGKEQNSFKNSEEFKQKYNEILEENKSKDNKSVKIEVMAEKCKCGEDDCHICNIFGVGAISESNPKRTKLYVRDCNLNKKHFIENSNELFKNLELEYTEIKTENSIDRITSTTKGGLRQFERVPAGARFISEMVYNIFEKKDIENLKHVLISMKLLEDDYLGGNGSRGYGRIEFKDIKIYVKTVRDYEEGNKKDKIYDKYSLDLIDQSELINILNDKLGAEKNEDSQTNTK